MYGNVDDPGLIYNTINFLIEKSQNEQFTISSSFFEIYNESLVDLMRGEDEQREDMVSIRTDGTENHLINLKVINIRSMDQFKKASESANNCRKVAATKRNDGSSRSHAIVLIRLSGIFNQKSFESSLMLLDLAGAENANDHLNDYDEGKRAAEMSKINKSLLVLRTVIEGLKKNNSSFVDFRSSKLTYLLKPCLTSNWKTLIITTASQERKYLTISKESLALASSANKIRIQSNKLSKS